MTGKESGSKRLDMPSPLAIQRGSSSAGYGGGTHTVNQAVPVALDEVLEALGYSGQ